MLIGWWIADWVLEDKGYKLRDRMIVDCIIMMLRLVTLPYVTTTQVQAQNIGQAVRYSDLARRQRTWQLLVSVKSHTNTIYCKNNSNKNSNAKAIIPRAWGLQTIENFFNSRVQAYKG